MIGDSRLDRERESAHGIRLTFGLVRVVSRRVARSCVTACTTDTIESAVHALAYDGVGCVVVLDVGKPVGMFTKRDALEAWLEAVPLDALCGSVANKTVITASPSMTRDEAAAIMMRHHVHHVCVTDGEGAFIGVCSSYDIARECGREACLPFWNEFMERVNVRARPSAPA